MTERRAGGEGNAGFTLLELLIALAILSLVVVALTGGVRFAGRAWQTQESRIDRDDDLASLQNVLRSLIASGRHFEGDNGSLEFVGEMPRALGLSGLFDIELVVSGDRLELGWRPHARPGEVAAEMDRTVLARGIDGLDLSYYLSDPHGAGAWTTGAVDVKRRPVLIRVMLLLPDKDGRLWPPLVVAPMTDRR